MGDAAQYDDPLFSPRQRPAEDPEGAASHYFVDYGDVRWIFIDNSCWQITGCDSFQLPSAQTQPGEAQFDFLERVAQEGTDAGKTVFVVMHMPTRGPRRPELPRHHRPDAHDGQGRVARQRRVRGDRRRKRASTACSSATSRASSSTEARATSRTTSTAARAASSTRPARRHRPRLLARVPPDPCRRGPDRHRHRPDLRRGRHPDRGPDSVAGGNDVEFAAFGKQPVFNDPAKVEALELRDPDPQPASSSLLSSSLWVHGRWLVPPLRSSSCSELRPARPCGDGCGSSRCRRASSR